MGLEFTLKLRHKRINILMPELGHRPSIDCWCAHTLNVRQRQGRWRSRVSPIISSPAAIPRHEASEVRALKRPSFTGHPPLASDRCQDRDTEELCEEARFIVLSLFLERFSPGSEGEILYLHENLERPDQDLFHLCAPGFAKKSGAGDGLASARLSTPSPTPRSRFAPRPWVGTGWPTPTDFF